MPTDPAVTPFIYTTNSGPDMTKELLDSLPPFFKALLGAKDYRPSDQLSIYVTTPKVFDGDKISQSLQPIGESSEEGQRLFYEEGLNFANHEQIKNLCLVFVDVLRQGKDFPLYNEALEFFMKNFGPVQTSYLLQNLNLLNNEKLLITLRMSSPEELLVLRRFGVVRNRVRGVDGIQETPGMDYLLPDSARPFVPGHVPPAFDQEFEGFHDTVHFKDSKDLANLWGVFADKFHSLALSRYRKSAEAGDRAAMTPNLLREIENEHALMDIRRAFFFVIESYETEKPLATVALIDGTPRSDRPYKLPVLRRIGGKSTLSIARSSEVYEIHSLAKDYDSRAEVSLEDLALLLAKHLQDTKLGTATFLVQTDVLGARLYRKFGFKVDAQASKGLPDKERVLYVRGQDFIDNVRKLFPHQRLMENSLPNFATKRLAGAENDLHCQKILFASAE